MEVSPPVIQRDSASASMVSGASDAINVCLATLVSVGPVVSHVNAAQMEVSITKRHVIQLRDNAIVNKM